MRTATKLALGLLRGRGGGVWTPLDLGATLKAWWDFGNASTLFVDAGVTPVSEDGDLIMRANNKAGALYHASETTNPPAYRTAVQNGQSVARFDGSNDQLIADSSKIISGANTSTVVAVVHKSGNTDDRTIYSENINGGPILFLLFRAGKAQWSVNSGSWSDATTAAAVADGWHIVVGWQDAAVATRIYVDGVIGNAGTGRATTSGTHPSRIGSNRMGGYYNSDIGELLLCDTALSVSNINTLGAYLAAKWGLSWTPVT